MSGFWGTLYIESYNLVFKESDKSISSESIDFTDTDFVAGNDILIKGSAQHNNRVLTITEITDNAITVSDTIKDENSGSRVIIHLVDFTEEIKMAVSDYIQFRMNKYRNTKSYRLGDYSEVEVSQTEMLEIFNPFKKLQWE